MSKQIDGWIRKHARWTDLEYQILFQSDSGQQLKLASAAGRNVPLASVAKIAALYLALKEVEAGRWSMSDEVEILPSDLALGSGLLSGLSSVKSVTMELALSLMIVLSDNTAADVIVRLLGLSAINREFASIGFRLERTFGELVDEAFGGVFADLSGLSSCEVRRKVFQGEVRMSSLDRVVANQKLIELFGYSEPQGAELANRLWRYCFCEGRLSAESMFIAQRLLGHSQQNARVGRKLPAGSRCMHKTGSLGLGAIVNDVGSIEGLGLPRVTYAFLTMCGSWTLRDAECLHEEFGTYFWELHRSGGLFEK